jgi:hypothetical protein
LVKDSSDSIEEAAVERLCDTVVLRSVMRDEGTLGALLPEELSKVIPVVLTAAVRTETNDASAMLSFCPGG